MTGNTTTAPHFTQRRPFFINLRTVTSADSRPGKSYYTIFIILFYSLIGKANVTKVVIAYPRFCNKPNQGYKILPFKKYRPTNN